MRWSYFKFAPASWLGRGRDARSGRRVARHPGTVLARLSLCGALPRLSIHACRRAGRRLGDAATGVGSRFITLIRVLVLIALASLIWTPIGVYVGLGPS